MFSSEKLFGWHLFNRCIVDVTRRKMKELDKFVEIFNKQISVVVNALLTNKTNSMADLLN